MKKIVIVFLFPLLVLAQISPQFLKLKPAYSKFVRYDYTGAIQSWTVPAGVTRIFFDVAGAQGTTVNSFGGHGGKISGILTVVPGAILQITVGGQSSNNIAVYGFGGNGGRSTFNGTTAGAGGGLSAISNAAPVTQANAFVIAAGGGGGCTGYSPRADGGAGGGLTGSDGVGGFDHPETSGKGATQSSGGSAGIEYNSNSTQATAGIALWGGNGGIVAVAWNGGGGGGAGYYGGGGGAGGQAAQGGGGGGSSWTVASSTVTDVVNVPDFNTGHGRVVIYWN